MYARTDEGPRPVHDANSNMAGKSIRTALFMVIHVRKIILEKNVVVCCKFQEIGF